MNQPAISGKYQNISHLIKYYKSVILYIVFIPIRQYPAIFLMFLNILFAVRHQSF